MNKTDKFKTSMRNEHNKTRLYRYYKLMSKFLINIDRSYKILIPNVMSWNNTLEVNVFELKGLLNHIKKRRKML